MKNNLSILGHLACFAAYAIFGFNIIVCKDLTSGHLLSPLTIFCLRAMGAGGLFWLISLFMPKEKVDKKDFLKIFLDALNVYSTYTEGISGIINSRTNGVRTP